MTFDGRHNYTYNADGYIASVDDGAITYRYDAEGNRILKRVKTASGTTDTRYIWLDGQLLAQQQPDGTWIDSIYAQGRRIASTSTHSDPTTGNPVADATTYFLTDTVGLTRVALSADGTVLSQGDFAPFGTLLRDRTSSTAPGITSAAAISFTGEVHDDETGLDTYKYRSYNPKLGRWMSPDPSGEHYASLANPQSLNLYSYVMNDPLKYVDSLGLDSDPVGDGNDGTDSGCDLNCGDGGGDSDGNGGGGGGGNPDPCGPTDGSCVNVPPDSCPVDACVTAPPDDPIDTTPPDPSDTFLPPEPGLTDQQRQTVEQAAQAAMNSNRAYYAAKNARLQPGDAASNLKMNLTDCDGGNHDCNYQLTGMGTNPATGQPYTYYVWEHETQQVAGSQPGSNNASDWITPAPGDSANANKFPDTLTGSLDTYRYFTVSTNPVYNQNSQVPINIFEGGQTISFEHIYSIGTGSPVYLNGSAQR